MKKLFKKRFMKAIFKKRKGFTLQEIMTVLLIIIILITVVVTYVSKFRADLRDNQRINDVGAVYLALENYRQDNGVYPAEVNPGEPLVGPNGQIYLDPVPHNPQPSDDGSCPSDTDYVYNFLEGGVSYALNYCLGHDLERWSAGPKVAKPDNIACQPDCLNKCAGIADGCGSVCVEGCASGYLCQAGVCVPPPCDFWTMLASSGQKNWQDVAGSSDLQKLAAVVWTGYLYTSGDGGQTWQERKPESYPLNWWSVATSADGQKIVAVVYSGYIYVSNNGGNNWSKITSSGLKFWHGVTASADGQKLGLVSQAGSSAGYIYTSSNGGSSWTPHAEVGSKTWMEITSSADGNKLAAVAYNDYVYTSTDSGQTWQPRTSLGKKYWTDIVSSSDGQKLAALDESGAVYTTVNGGDSWTKRSTSGFFSLASSADGNSLAAGKYASYISTSTNGGETWKACTASTKKAWTSLILAADGSKIIAVDNNNGYIYSSP